LEKHDNFTISGFEFEFYKTSNSFYKNGISNFYAIKIEESKFEKLILDFSVKETT